MDDEGHEHAVISDAAYKYYEHGAEHAQNELDDFLEGYTIDPDYSDDHAVTVLRPDGSAIVGYRGTDPWNIYDIGADALILSGYHREKQNMIPYTRFQRASDHYERVAKEHNIASVTGHSLGGTLADFVGRRFDTKAYAFNAGETPFEFARFGLVAPSKTISYTTGTDPISASGFAYRNHQKIVQVPKTVEGGYHFLDTHSLKNFLPQKKERKETAKTAERVAARKKLCELFPEKCPKGQ
jgi:hypothetical protein